MIPITSEKHNYTIWCDTKVTFQATHALASSMILDDIRELHLIPSQYLALLHLEIHIYLQQSIQIRSDFFRKLKSSSAVSTTKILCFKQKPSNKGQTWDLVQKRGEVLLLFSTTDIWDATYRVFFFFTGTHQKVLSAKKVDLRQRRFT